MGLLPFLLAVGSLSLRRGPLRYRWVSWCVVLTALGSLGVFGIGWMVHSIWCSVPGNDPRVHLLGDHVGGLYWLMVVCLPGYAQFRYPAKLLVVAALGISLLAARGWDRAFVRGDSRTGRTLATVAGMIRRLRPRSASGRRA